MKFKFTKISDEEAREIARWRYAPPYDFYDSVNDPDDLAELLDPADAGTTTSPLLTKKACS